MSDDSVPELADAIHSLINASPRSPTKGELEKVIRDHVQTQLHQQLGGPVPDGVGYANVKYVNGTTVLNTGHITTGNTVWTVVVSTDGVAHDVWAVDTAG